MALVRAERPTGSPETRSVEPDPLTQLLDNRPTERRRACRRLVEQGASAVEPLARALAPEPEPSVREAIVTALLEIGRAGPAEVTKAVASAMVGLVDDRSAAVRNDATLVLQGLGPAAGDTLLALLESSSADVRILGLSAVAGASDRALVERIPALLEREADPRVCGAAIDVLMSANDPLVTTALEQVRARFPNDPYLSFLACLLRERGQGTGA